MSVPHAAETLHHDLQPLLTQSLAHVSRRMSIRQRGAEFDPEKRTATPETLGYNQYSGISETNLDAQVGKNWRFDRWVGHYLLIPSESGFTTFDAIGNEEIKETTEIERSAKNRRYSEYAKGLETKTLPHGITCVNNLAI